MDTELYKQVYDKTHTAGEHVNVVKSDADEVWLALYDQPNPREAVTYRFTISDDDIVLNRTEQIVLIANKKGDLHVQTNVDDPDGDYTIGTHYASILEYCIQFVKSIEFTEIPLQNVVHVSSQHIYIYYLTLVLLGMGYSLAQFTDDSRYIYKPINRSSAAKRKLQTQVVRKEPDAEYTFRILNQNSEKSELIAFTKVDELSAFIVPASIKDISDGAITDVFYALLTITAKLPKLYVPIGSCTPAVIDALLQTNRFQRYVFVRANVLNEQQYMKEQQVYGLSDARRFEVHPTPESLNFNIPSHFLFQPFTQ